MKKGITRRSNLKLKTFKSIESIFQNVPMLLNPTTQMECARTVTTLKGEPRKHQLVNTLIEFFMPKASARIATSVSIIRRRELLQSNLMIQPQK
jgi:hypothetical protein